MFVEKVGKPDRTYVWGDSLGGLITQMLAEKHPDWVAGAAPLCGVLGGTNLNLDLALDVAYAVKTLIDPEPKLTGYAILRRGGRELRGRREGGRRRPAGHANGVPGKILLVAALVDAPTQTETYDGSTSQSQVERAGRVDPHRRSATAPSAATRSSSGSAATRPATPTSTTPAGSRRPSGR